MSNRTRPRIVSGAGTLFSSLWVFYSNVNTAADLPKDASAFAKMIADPPIYMHWLILAASIFVFTWSIWPHRDSDPVNEPQTPTNENNIYNQIHTGSGNNEINF